MYKEYSNSQLLEVIKHANIQLAEINNNIAYIVSTGMYEHFEIQSKVQIQLLLCLQYAEKEIAERQLNN